MIMNSTILLSTAILATALLQPLEAKPKENKGGGKKPAAAQNAQAAPKQMAQRPHPVQKQMAQHSKGSQKQFAQHNPQPSQKQFHQRTQGPATAARGGHGNNKFQNQNRKQQTIAFGGAKQRSDERDANFQANRRSERNVTVDNRRYGGDRYIRNDYRQYRPPTYVFRDWDRGRVHSWNNHSYRWYNNDWIIIDAGFGSPYYGYDSGPVVEYGISDNTAVAVQRELSRRGYDPGVIDGVIGPQSRDAIAAYQQDNGLPVTGRIDGPLLREMGL